MLILDNGSHTIKVTDGKSPIKVVQNCITRSKDDRRIYVSDELDDAKFLGTLQYRRAHEKGYLTNWESEKAIWDRVLGTHFPKLERQKTGLLLTEAPHNLATLQANCDEMVFEEYKFAEYIRCTPASLIPWGNLTPTQSDLGAIETLVGTTNEEVTCREAVLVVDAGHSFTHITPVIDGVPDHARTRRLTIGGKVLTNVLKEMISLRQYNMMEETHLVSQIKEVCCFVSLDFDGDMARAHGNDRGSKAPPSLLKTFVLPDFSRNSAGFVADSDTELSEDVQVLKLGFELFTVPELLFRPSDIGLEQCGIVEGVMQAVDGMSEPMMALCLANIVLVGGSTKFPGFIERFKRELRAVAPDIFEIGVYAPEDPITYAAACGLRMVQDDRLVKHMQITRKQYGDSNKKASLKFNQGLLNLAAGQVTPTVSEGRRRESKYEETSDRSDTPRSFSPDTEPEDQVMEENDGE